MISRDNQRDEARQWIEAAQNEDDAAISAQMAQWALASAVLAVADELAGIRDKVEEVAQNLVDQDNHSAGMHMRYISDWLQKIAERR